MEHLDDANVIAYLKNVGIAPRNQTLRVEPVGDGNINWVRRVRGRDRTWVVKQARPALERFPEYRVSTERIVFEARYYEAVKGWDPGRICPRVRHFDAGARVLVLEDLGDVERLDAALARRADVRLAAAALAAFLGTVHRETRGAPLAEHFCNAEMQRLHGEHIFALPFRPNDFPLSPAVAERATTLRADAELLALIDASYRRYLLPEGCLVHGDVQPANVLLTERGPVLLDAEIAHVGDPAFDLGQLTGHLLLPSAAEGSADAARDTVRAAAAGYADAAGELPGREAVGRYAGIELLRRTVGAARAPAVAGDAASLATLEIGSDLVRDGLPATWWP